MAPKVKPIPDDPMLPKYTDKCRCMECGLYFNSSGAFTRHRVGEYAPINQPDTRRCLTVEVLRRRRWAQTETGHWAREVLSGNAKARIRQTPSPDTGL